MNAVSYSGLPDSGSFVGGILACCVSEVVSVERLKL